MFDDNVSEKKSFSTRYQILHEYQMFVYSYSKEQTLEATYTLFQSLTLEKLGKYVASY